MRGWLPGQLPDTRQADMEQTTARQIAALRKAVNKAGNAVPAASARIPAYQAQTARGVNASTLAQFNGLTVYDIGEWQSSNGAIAFVSKPGVDESWLFSMVVATPPGSPDITVPLPILRRDSRLYVYLDGALQAGYTSPSSTPVTCNITLSAGEHTVQFLLNNDGGSDCGLLIAAWLATPITWRRAGSVTG